MDKLEERLDTARMAACSRTAASSPFLYYTFFRPGQRNSVVQILVEVLHLQGANWVQVPAFGWQVLLEPGPASSTAYIGIERRVASEIGDENTLLVLRETCPVEGKVESFRTGIPLSLYDERTCARMAGTAKWVKVKKGKISYV